MIPTAEKETCQYVNRNGYTHTECGEVEFADVREGYKYCPDCGSEIERIEKSDRRLIANYYGGTNRR